MSMNYRKYASMKAALELEQQKHVDDLERKRFLYDAMVELFQYADQFVPDSELEVRKRMSTLYQQFGARPWR